MECFLKAKLMKLLFLSTIMKFMLKRFQNKVYFLNDLAFSPNCLLS